MKQLWKTCTLLAFVAFALTPALRAQGVTSAAMTGVVTDASGNPVVGAHVSAVHVPSGTGYTATTRAEGRFDIAGMRVGGPYRVSVAYVGYRGQIQENLFLTLGVTADVHFTLEPVTVQLGEITISGTTDPVFSSERTGAATAIPSAQIEKLPTITRRVEDMLRLTPEYSPNSYGYSFAGQQNFFNNMTIDGSYFNNSFGLAGQPGDRTGVAAVSLDALEQIEVNVAPYDVRQGNFVGAGINMVTKSGTNNFSGSLFYTMRNNNFVGTQAGPNVVNVGTFKYSDIGATLGGPIVRNKLFFFLSFENDANTAPGTTYIARDSASQTIGGNVTRVLKSDLDSISAFMLHSFNYTTGAYQGYDFKVPSTRFLARLDYNLNDRNKLSLRFNLLNSESPTLMSNSRSLGVGSVRSNLSSLNFANSNYAILENIRSVIGEWNTTIGSRMSNSVIFGYNQSDESRKNITPPWFPLIEILNGGSAYTALGFEPFTPDNQLRYHNYQFQDNFTIYLPKHSLTFGTSIEKYHSDNVFFPGAQSVYVYNSLADFYTDLDGYLANPSRTGPAPVSLNMFQYRYSNIPGQTEPMQPLDVLYAGVYAQDEWRPNREWTITAGIRVDAPRFGNTAYDNAVADTMKFRDASGNTVSYNSGKLPGINPLFSPRLGFNWDLRGEHRTQIRGGTGIFSGRPAYVWISNQIGNTGVLTGFISATNTTAYPFNPNPNAYAPPASSITGAPASSFELALTDPKYKFPQVWRSNIAVDQRLPWGLTGTAEFLYTKDVNGIGYENVNLPAAQAQFNGPDARPRWTSNRIYSNVADAIVLTNEGIGKAWNLSFSLEKPFTSGLYGKVGYTFGRSWNTGDPGSIAYGNWTGITTPGDPNNPGLGYSSFSPGSRFFAALTYSKDFFGFGATSVSVYFSGNTQGNYSYTTYGDMNGDGVNGNDLIYIPRDTSEMRFVRQIVTVGSVADTLTPAEQAVAWNAFINQDPYLSKHRGQYAQRNAAFFPMVWRGDLSISQDLGRMIGGASHRLQVRLDMLNFTNWLNHNWGVGSSLTTSSPLTYRGQNAAGEPTYYLYAPGGQLITSTFKKSASVTNDVWRMQLAVKYFFN